LDATVGSELRAERLDRWIARECPSLSRSQIKAAIEAGGARVNGVTVESPASRVKSGDQVELAVAETARAEPQPEALSLEILYEDDTLIAVNKPAGLVVHPGAGGETGTLVSGLLHHCGAALAAVGESERPGIVHRLDKDTSGVLVAAKTAPAYRALTEQFAAHSIDRRYRAFLRGHPRPASGAVEAPIARHRRDRKKMAVRPGGKAARTQYTVETLYAMPDGTPLAAAVQCRLETGRTHQVRVHMAHLGHAVLGDGVYGGRRALPKSAPKRLRETIAALPRQALHAESLAIRHPETGEILKFVAELPNDLDSLAKALDRYAETRVPSRTSDDT